MSVLRTAILVGLAGCASTRSAPSDGSPTSREEPVAASPSPETQAEAEDGNPEDTFASNFAYAARGHAFVRRLLCPSGLAPDLEAVGTAEDDLGRLEDTYALRCGTELQHLRFPRDEEPEVPESWSVISPEDVQAFREAADSSEPEDWAEAEAVVSRLLERHPTWAAARRLRAVARLRTLQHEAAWSDLEKIKHLSDDLRFEWAFVGARLGRCDAVAKDLEALEASHDQGWASYAVVVCVRAQCLMETGRKAEADEMAARACELGAPPCCPSSSR